MRSLEEKAVRLLAGVVEDDILRSYLHLLGNGGCVPDEAANSLGGAEKVDRLLHSGMAEVQEPVANGPPRLLPAPMDVVMQQTLASLAQDALHDYERLLDGYKRMCAYSTSSRAAADPSVGQLAQIITDSDQVGQLTSTLLKSVRREWLTLSSHAPTAPVGGVDGGSTPQSLEDGADCRAIYDAARIKDGDARGKLEMIVETGVQVRILPRVRMSLRLADEAIALLPLTSAETASALLVQSSVIVGAFREYFELLWERAIPFGFSGLNSHGLPEDQIKILRLLVQGLPDENISERIGVSLTTVRRQIKTLREQVGAETRFQLGVVAVQEGLVD